MLSHSSVNDIQFTADSHSSRDTHSPFNPRVYIESRLLHSPSGSTMTNREMIAKRSKHLLNESEFKLDQTVDKLFSSLWLSPHEIICGTKNSKLLLLNPLTLKVTEIELGINQTQRLGIYSFELNDTCTLLALASGCTVNVYAFPAFKLVHSLVGHLDIVYNVRWVSNECLLTSSKDGTFRQWHLNCKHHLIRLIQAQSETCHSNIGKIRNMTTLNAHQTALTLSTDGCIKLWDVASFVTFSSIALQHTKELIAFTTNGTNTAFVGSNQYITVVDLRSGKIVNSFRSMDDRWGVRCLEYGDNVLTIGGGYGRMSFYDTRNAKYLTWDNEASHSCFHESGKGSIVRNECYDANYSDSIVKHGICTISYNKDRTRLFAGGGPIQTELMYAFHYCLIQRGSYASVW